MDFGDDLLRVSSDYQTFVWATGAPMVWTSTYAGPEITEITSSFTADLTNSQASSPRATSSAVAGWLLYKDDSSGVATLSNVAAGTTAIVNKYDPTVTAMSWAAQSTSLELGEEVSQGEIDWNSGIFVSASGGSFLSSYDSVKIHDPIVVWTRNRNSNVIESSTLFEFTAEFDSKTEIHWNEVREIQAGVDGPELVIIPNDGPFLDASLGGSGSFRLSLDSNLLRADERGTLEFVFKDGIVTTSTATGVFSDLAPREVPLDTTLPPVGSPAIIDSILVDNNVTGGRFSLNLDVGPDRVISDVAACSDGVHISVGAVVDTIKTFTHNPMQRWAVTQVSADAENKGLPRPCLGDVREDAELLFGNSYSPSANASLHPESRTNPIDRFLRLDVGPDAPQKTIVFDPGENSLPADTRRWTAEFDVRLSHVPDRSPHIEPIDVVIVDDDAGDANDGRQAPGLSQGSTTSVVGVSGAAGQSDGALRTGEVDPIRGKFAIGLLDVASYGVMSEGDVAFDDQEISLFRKTDGVVLTMIDQPDAMIAQLTVDGNIVAKAFIPPQDRRFSFVTDHWQHFELGLEQQHAGVAVQLNLVSDDGTYILNVIDETISEMRLSPDGYRLAIGALIHQDDVMYDFDNLMMTFRQAGDVAWDGIINVDDFHVLSRAIESKHGAPIFDIDLNGRLDFGDLELLEDLIPNKIPGDANLDGVVNFPDFITLTTFFGESTGLWTRGDFDSDGRVALKDFVLLVQNFGNADIQPSQQIPEPMSVTMLLLGVCALGRLRLSRRVI